MYGPVVSYPSCLTSKPLAANDPCDDLCDYVNPDFVVRDRWVCACVCARARVRACVRAFVYARVLARPCASLTRTHCSVAFHFQALHSATDPAITAFVRVNTATNWASFNAALKTYVAPSQNFVFADAVGNIGLVIPGQMPIRGSNHTGLYPVPGDGSTDWLGIIPQVMRVTCHVSHVMCHTSHVTRHTSKPFPRTACQCFSTRRRGSL